MLRRISLALFALSLLSAGAALADNPVSDKANITFYVPDAWQTEVIGESLVLSDAKGEVALKMWAVDGKELKDVFKSIDKDIAAFATGVKVKGKAVEASLNGMKT